MTTIKKLTQLIKQKSGIDWTPDTVYDWDTASYIHDKLWEQHSIVTDIIWHPDGYKVILNDPSKEFNHTNR